MATPARALRFPNTSLHNLIQRHLIRQNSALGLGLGLAGHLLNPCPESHLFFPLSENSNPNTPKHSTNKVHADDALSFPLRLNLGFGGLAPDRSRVEVRGGVRPDKFDEDEDDDDDDDVEDFVDSDDDGFDDYDVGGPPDPDEFSLKGNEEDDDRPKFRRRK